MAVGSRTRSLPLAVLPSRPSLTKLRTMEQTFGPWIPFLVPPSNATRLQGGAKTDVSKMLEVRQGHGSGHGIRMPGSQAVPAGEIAAENLCRPATKRTHLVSPALSLVEAVLLVCVGINYLTSLPARPTVRSSPNLLVLRISLPNLSSRRCSIPTRGANYLWFSTSRVL